MLVLSDKPLSEIVAAMPTNHTPEQNDWLCFSAHSGAMLLEGWFIASSQFIQEIKILKSILAEVFMRQ